MGTSKCADGGALPPRPAKADGAQHEKAARGVTISNQLHKTKICTYYLRGTCQFGTECAFAHSRTELQTAPDLRKTRLCSAFMEGYGCENPACTYAHGEEELRSTDMFYKKSLCAWNEKGRCRNGEQCRFAHGAEELRKCGGGAGSVDQGDHALQPGGSRCPTEPMKIAPTSGLFDAAYGLRRPPGRAQSLAITAAGGHAAAQPRFVDLTNRMPRVPPR
mmetsp:Transcript_113943/g.322582  ORF Transcript_113943/g.322582 Transcript_113943/m.322582 type:complete len:219 (-) Transcript_113943:90-746(-)